MNPAKDCTNAMISLQKRGITSKGKGSEDYNTKKGNYSAPTGKDRVNMENIEDPVTNLAENHSSQHKGIIL